MKRLRSLLRLTETVLSYYLRCKPLISSLSFLTGNVLNGRSPLTIFRDGAKPQEVSPYPIILTIAGLPTLTPEQEPQKRTHEPDAKALGGRTAPAPPLPGQAPAGLTHACRRGRTLADAKRSHQVPNRDRFASLHHNSFCTCLCFFVPPRAPLLHL